MITRRCFTIAAGAAAMLASAVAIAAAAEEKPFTAQAFQAAQDQGKSILIETWPSIGMTRSETAGTLKKRGSGKATLRFSATTLRRNVFTTARARTRTLTQLARWWLAVFSRWR